MRSTRERILHAISFEIIGLALVMPLGVWVFDLSPHDSGAVGIAGATLATVWNYFYNLGFDHLLLRLRGSVAKTLVIRVLHAVGFELGLLMALMPMIALWLGISLQEAFLMDMSFAGFYLGYAFVFNWAYDRIFPTTPGSRTLRSRRMASESAR